MAGCNRCETSYLVDQHLEEVGGDPVLALERIEGVNLQCGIEYDLCAPIRRLRGQLEFVSQSA